VIRYRTGDIVRVAPSEASKVHNCNFLWLPEGVIGRVDNMVTIRGVNIFPSSIDSLLREVSAVSEYTVQVTRQGQLDQLAVTVEGSVEAGEQLEKLLTIKLGLRVPVQCVPLGTLPRSDGKSRRWQDLRSK
jgi:phenylacetate-CoA ligase